MLFRPDGLVSAEWVSGRCVGDDIEPEPQATPVPPGEVAVLRDADGPCASPVLCVFLSLHRREKSNALEV